MTTLAGLMYPRRQEQYDSIDIFPVWADYGLIHKHSDVQVTVTLDTLMLQMLNRNPNTVYVEIDGEIVEIDKRDLEVEIL